MWMCELRPDDDDDDVVYMRRIANKKMKLKRYYTQQKN